MSEAEARVAQEGAGQRGLPADAGQAAAQWAAQAGEVGGTHVGQFTRLHIAPDLFEGIQLRGVGGQPLHGEPGALPAKIRGHVATLVAAQAVPDQHDPAAAKMPLERAHEGHQGPVGVCAGGGVEEEAAAPAVPAKRQGARHRQALPVAAGVPEDRRFAARRPGATDYRVLRDAAFVLEDEPGPLPRGVFFSRGQRVLFHSAIAASSRSRAWRPGRWIDHPKPRSTRQTWPG